MDKQQSDHIDNTIRQAAENISVPFKEEAWTKMELLLDKDQKDRRGLIWLWAVVLLCILFGSGIYLLTNRQTGKEPAAQQSAQVTRSHPQSRDNQPGKPSLQVPRSQPIQPRQQASDDQNKPDIQNNSQTKAGQQYSDKPQSQAHKQNPDNQLSQVDQQPRKYLKAPTSQQSQAILHDGANRQAKVQSLLLNQRGRRNVQRQSPPNLPAANQRDLLAQGNQQPTAAGQPGRDKQQVPRQADPDTAAHRSTVAGTQPPSPPPVSATKDSAQVTPVMAKAPAPRLQSPRKAHGIYFLAAVARNASDVKGLTSNNLAYRFGAGVGYQLTGRWLVQTGFYAGRKIYNAGPEDYHTKEGSLYNATIKSINANCYIFELPLSVRYDIVHKGSFNVYGMTGLSSFIMKKENYIYHYNDVYGRYRFLDTNYRGNINVFAVMNVSVGVEKKIINGLYLQAEPYVKLPVAGIGEGKVKLYDAGVQLGIRYQPPWKNKAH